MGRLQSRKFFLIFSVIVAAFALSYIKNFDPTMLISTSLGFYFGANVYEKRGELQKQKEEK